MGKSDKKKSSGKGIFLLMILVGLAGVVAAGLAQVAPENLDSVSFVKNQLAVDNIRYAVGGVSLAMVLFGFLVVKPGKRKR